MGDFEKLLSLFKSNPNEAIEECQNLICSVTDFDSYKEFYLYHLQHPHMSTCQREWTKPQMAIHCYDCAKNPQSCICLECFLKGSHKDHEYIIRGDSCGNCDCGDLSLWKQSGFCPHHHGVEQDTHPEDYLDEKLRTTLTDFVFKAALTALLSFDSDEDSKIPPIIQFVSSFLEFGDGFRRLIVISFTEKVGSKVIFNHVFEASKMFNEQLEKLCGGLINDDVFRCQIASTVCDVIIQRIMPEDFKFSSKTDTNYSSWNSFWFHSFSPRPFEYSIQEKGWDWVSFTLEFSKLMKKHFAYLGVVPLEYNTPSYITEVTVNIPRSYHAQTAEQTQHLFDELFTKVLNCGSSEESPDDDKVVVSFSDTFQENYYRTLYTFKIYYFYLMDCFKFKKELKLDKLFEELDKNVNISPIFCIGKNMIGDSADNENDKFISKFLNNSVDLSTNLNPNYFKSFHNGASFFYSLPLYDSLMRIFRTDNINRVKIARFLSMEKYQSLRVRLGIITLKNFLSYSCLHQSLTSNNNHSLKLFMQILLKPECLSLSLPFYLPLFQLLLGLQCNDSKVTDEFSLKEFFAFEMTREIGLFDDFQSHEYVDEETEPLQKQMTFSVLYMAILIVIERTLFNFNTFNFIEEQIIMALKSGVSQLDKLSTSFDCQLDNHYRQIFNKIISEITTTSRNSEKKKDDDDDDEGATNSSFFLKKDVEWKTITALNLFNTQKVILEKEITTNQNKLLQIPEFEEEENYFFHEPRRYKKPEVDEYDIDTKGLNIRLKEFLFTPTIMAVVYHTLRGASEKNTATLNDHLAMMVLVLVSRFANEIEAKDPPPFNESTVIQYDSSLVDLISKFKKIIFDQKETIRNTLDKKSFMTFINVKIGSPDHEPKSFIDILLEKGETGKNVLIQLSVDISKYGFKDSNAEMSQAEINKKRANKLKAEIMNQYKEAISNYNFIETDQLDENPSLSSTIGDSCSICSTIKKNEILYYTVYIYRTKLPFAFDKPPIASYNPQIETPVDDDFKDYLFEDDNKGEEEEEEEEGLEEPNLEEMTKILKPPQSEDEYQMFFLLRSLILDDYFSKLRAYEKQKVKKQHKERMLQYKKEVLDSDAYSRGVSDTDRMVTAGKNFVIQFSICQHPVHYDCINGRVFNCPIDRSRRNGLLPAIDGIQKEKIFKDYNACHDITEDALTDEFQTSLQNFLCTYATFIDYGSILTELIKSISGLISTFEVRLRSLPDCLDSTKTKLLSRNLFLTTWYLYRIDKNLKIRLTYNYHLRFTVFQKLILRLIECDELVQADNNSIYNEHTKEVFMGIISSFVNSPDFSQSSDPLRREKELYLFLKRACLADHFLLNNENVSSESEFSSLLDWDEILSVTNLSEYYKVDLGLLSADKNGEDFEFKPFVFCRMPKEFLEFAQKPFNFRVELTHQYVLFNMIDYNYLIKNHDDFNDSAINEEEELQKNQRNVTVFNPGAAHSPTILTAEYSSCVYPSVFLSIGEKSSEVLVVNEDVIGTMEPFYLDRLGCNDVGYQRGMPLFLNEDKYERLIDEILSGDFSFYLQS